MLVVPRDRVVLVGFSKLAGYFGSGGRGIWDPTQGRLVWTIGECCLLEDTGYPVLGLC